MQPAKNPQPAARGPGRPREFDLERALDKAIKIFSKQGYNGTSISDLAAAMEVTAGSLYKAFPDKHAIFMGAFERYLSVRQENLAKRLAALSTGHAQVEAILLHYADYSSGAEGRQGCLVVGSTVELASVDAEIAARVTQQLDKYQQRFEDLIRKGQQDGSIAAHVVPVAAASLLVCITQGMRVVGKAGRSASEINTLVASAMTMLA